MQTQILTTKKSKRGVNVKSDFSSVSLRCMEEIQVQTQASSLQASGKGLWLKESMGWDLTYWVPSGSKQEESQGKKCFAKRCARTKPMSALHSAQHLRAKKSDGDSGEPVEVTLACRDPLTGQRKLMESQS